MPKFLLKQVNSNFAYDENGDICGYYKKSEGADTVHPFRGKISKTLVYSGSGSKGINQNIDVTNLIPNYHNVSVDNFSYEITSTSCRDPYAMKATFGLKDISLSYNPDTGILTFSSGWHNTDTTGYSYETETITFNIWFYS